MIVYNNRFLIREKIIYTYKYQVNLCSTQLRIGLSKLYISFLCINTLLLFPFIVEADNNKSQLKYIQQYILKKENDIQLQRQQRNKLINQLHTHEKIITESDRKIRQTQHQLIHIDKNLITIAYSIEQLIKQQKIHESLLAQQIVVTFRRSKHSKLHLLFNNEYNQRNARIFSYFNYINKARKKTIRELQQKQSDLVSHKAFLLKKQIQQKKLLSTKQSQKKRLEKTHIKLKNILENMDHSLKQNQFHLAKMHKNANFLLAKIARTEHEAKIRAKAKLAVREEKQLIQNQKQVKVKIITYKSIKNKHTVVSYDDNLNRINNRQVYWPVRGYIKHYFGEVMQGDLRWKGLVIHVPEGTEVKAIADGRVLMADWLQGYGLVVVIEHGKDDMNMSLYGYNQSTLVKTGDRVVAGQPIALVGNSGKYGIPSLYFEIRRQGQAINPLPWLRK